MNVIEHHQKPNTKVLIFVSLLAFALLVAIVILFYVLAIILPLKTDKIYLLSTKDKSEQIYTLLPIDEISLLINL